MTSPDQADGPAPLCRCAGARRSAAWHRLPLLIGLALCACQAIDPAGHGLTAARQIAATAGMSPLLIPAGPFTLQAFVRTGGTGDTPLTVYLEGDGRAYRDAVHASADPTPRRPIALLLAAADPAPAVAYLARPCQFATPGPQPCTPAQWTTDRFNPLTVAALDDALTRLQTRLGRDRLNLIGFSGGGTLATLLAARRRDINLLVTLAAPLDLPAWTGRLRLTPLAAAQNPRDAAAQLGTLRQVHITGDQDEIVADPVNDGYFAALPPLTPARRWREPGQDHDCCWAAAWPRLRRQIDLPTPSPP